MLFYFTYQINDDDDDAESKKKRPVSVQSSGISAAGIGDDKPPPLAGWLEKKSPNKLVGKDWQRRYVLV